MSNSGSHVGEPAGYGPGANGDAPLTEIQQRLMAYVDDEMTPQDRESFEQELSSNPELAAEAAGFQTLADITKSMSLAEPTDHEMRRFWESFYNRSEWQLGWVLLLSGLGILAAFGLYFLLVSEVYLLIKIATVSAGLGAGILFWNTLRLKIRTSRFDRYRGVMR